MRKQTKVDKQITKHNFFNLSPGCKIANKKISIWKYPLPNWFELAYCIWKHIFGHEIAIFTELYFKKPKLYTKRDYFLLFDIHTVINVKLNWEYIIIFFLSEEDGGCVPNTKAKMQLKKNYYEYKEKKNI